MGRDELRSMLRGCAVASVFGLGAVVLSIVKDEAVQFYLLLGFCACVGVFCRSFWREWFLRQAPSRETAQRAADGACTGTDK